jgi:alpha-glucosidase (family GH31 glycosyl hydrolase)
MPQSQIVHTPYGQEHPYEQLPEERFPREPLAGQPFTMGLVSRPPGAVTHVVVHQQIDGQSVPPIEAQRVANWRPELEEGVGAEFLERIVKIEQDVWQAILIAPEMGKTLTYWAEVEGGLCTERATLRGETWQNRGINVHIEGATLRITPDADSKPVLPSGPELRGVEWLTDGSRARRVRLTFHSQPDEAFFGLGERFNALNQRGNVLDIRCYEQYKSQGKRTYIPIPFLLSLAGYALFVDSRRWMQFDLAASSGDCWSLEADLDLQEGLRLQWFSGSDPIDLISQFTRQTGPAKLPPDWAFGLWMSANEWNSQGRVLREVQKSLDLGIPPSVVVIEAWSDETTFYIWNDAQYQPKAGSETFQLSDFTFPAEGKWPDPKGMIDWLHQHNVKLILWQIPALKILEAPHAQHEADRAYFEQQGFGVRNPDGSLHRIRPFWFRGGYIWDVTNTAGCVWWLNKRRYLLDEMGIDGFKTDGGEHLWGASTRFADGRRGHELWNEYPQRYTQRYYEFANRYREALTFSRSGHVGSQRSPAHWAGDENSTWDAFRHTILAGLSAGISGIPFWGWDIGGFSGELPTAELYLRGAAMATFCPIMQYHSEYNQHREPARDRTPWNIQAYSGDDRVVGIFRSFVALRHALLPYILQEARHSASTGEPMMRALKLLDRRASDYQYLFGGDLLVSPVTEPGAATWKVYLPAGTWYDLWTKEPVTGPTEITAPAPLDRIPVFIREGSALIDLRLP